MTKRERDLAMALVILLCVIVLSRVVAFVSEVPRPIAVAAQPAATATPVPTATAIAEPVEETDEQRIQKAMAEYKAWLDDVDQTNRELAKAAEIRRIARERVDKEMAEAASEPEATPVDEWNAGTDKP